MHPLPLHHTPYPLPPTLSPLIFHLPQVSWDIQNRSVGNNSSLALTIFPEVEGLAGIAVSQYLGQLQAQVDDQQPSSGVQQEADEIPVGRQHLSLIYT